MATVFSEENMAFRNHGFPKTPTAPSKQNKSKGLIKKYHGRMRLNTPSAISASCSVLFLRQNKTKQKHVNKLWQLTNIFLI